MPADEQTDLMKVHHGRKIFEQTQKILAGVQELKPLLELLRELPVESGMDPIKLIINLLEQIVQNQRSQNLAIERATERLEAIQRIITAKG
ncbi:MAG TPA: hypothetical protein VGV41_17950 [Pseudolabrys sp.]|uniref:hypothetical protein n=1 Tax=Pseudolabrys sp. TaxID=1960880 RepID=UPI002DDD232C|nr:hypothetical protein [Pseudolabrys sp.]HEV2630515.1 hypothetical protein [Pseudolabrys sp.]